MQNYVPLGNSKSKNQDPWKFHMVFSWLPLEIQLFFKLTSGLRNINMLYLYPWKFHALAPSILLFFFWNSSNPFSRNLIDTDGFQNCSKWITKTAKHFKWNTINDNRHGSETFDEEIPLVKEKFMETDYSLCFINTVVNEFQKG